MNSQKTPQNYYLNQNEKYWKQLGRLFRSSERILPDYLDKSMTVDIEQATKAKFEHLLADLPYIGGNDNPLTFTFVSSACALAYIRALEQYGLSVETIGTILNKVYEDIYAALSRPARWFLKWYEFSPANKRKLKALARESQLRKYPENWVMEYIEGDGIQFDYAYHYSECAVLKYFQRMDALEYMPYLCVTDLTASKVLKTGLERTTTLHYGGSCCDFQYKKNRPSLPGIPIQNLPEYKNRK